jgi:signal peptidase I
VSLRRWFFLISLGVGGALVLRTFFFDTVSVASGSMQPTLFVGTHYLVNRIVYRFHEPKRGDIVSFVSPLDHRSRYIKRVIAIPGDQIEIREKHVVLNGKSLDEPYTVHTRAEERLVGDNLGPLTVPAGKVFVLGDNRDESFDSSVWKDPDTGERIYFLPLKSIRGRLIQIP